MNTKSFITLIILLFFTVLVKSQVKETNCISSLDSVLCKIVYSTVDKMPIPVHGERKLYKELIQNLSHKVDSSNTTGSRVFVGFVVEIDGKVTGKRIFQNINGSDLANQALTIAENLEWIPGSCNGKNVPVLYTLPIIICLK